MEGKNSQDLDGLPLHLNVGATRQFDRLTALSGAEERVAPTYFFRCVAPSNLFEGVSTNRSRSRSTACRAPTFISLFSVGLLTNRAFRIGRTSSFASLVRTPILWIQIRTKSVDLKTLLFLRQAGFGRFDSLLFGKL